MAIRPYPFILLLRHPAKQAENRGDHWRPACLIVAAILSARRGGTA